MHLKSIAIHAIFLFYYTVCSTIIRTYGFALQWLIDGNGRWNWLKMASKPRLPVMKWCSFMKPIVTRLAQHASRWTLWASKISCPSTNNTLLYIIAVLLITAFLYTLLTFNSGSLWLQINAFNKELLISSQLSSLLFRRDCHSEDLSSLANLVLHSWALRSDWILHHNICIRFNICMWLCIKL